MSGYDNRSGSESEDDDFNPAPEVDEEDVAPNGNAARKPAVDDEDEEGDEEQATAPKSKANDEEDEDEDEEGGGDEEENEDDEDEEDEDEDDDEDVVVRLPRLIHAIVIDLR